MSDEFDETETDASEFEASTGGAKSRFGQAPIGWRSVSIARWVLVFGALAAFVLDPLRMTYLKWVGLTADTLITEETLLAAIITAGGLMVGKRLGRGGGAA